MKSYDERIESIFKKYDARLAEQKRRRSLIFRSMALGVGAAAIIGIGVFANVLKPPERPTVDNSGIIAETTAVTTEKTTSEPSVQTEISTSKTIEGSETSEISKTTVSNTTAEAKKTSVTTSTAVTHKTTSAESTSNFAKSDITPLTTAHNTSIPVTTSTAVTASPNTSTTAVSTSVMTSNKTTSQTTSVLTTSAITTTTVSTETSPVTTKPYTYTDDTFMYVREYLSDDIYRKTGVDVDESQFGIHLMISYATELDTEHIEDVELYELKGIDRRCAVVIKYLDVNACPVYMNTSYEPETLGDLLTDMDITERISFSENNIQSAAEKKYYTASSEKILNILNENTTAVNTKESSTDIKQDLVIFAKLPYIKDEVSFAISKQGYITTDLIENGASFYIGREKAEEYINYLLENK